MLSTFPLKGEGRDEGVNVKRRKFFQLLSSLAGALPIAGLAASKNIKPISRSLLVLDSRIAGFAYYEGSQWITQIKPADPLTFRREPTNTHDHRAIEIFWNERKLGYVPRSHNRALYKLMDAGEMVVGEVKRVDEKSWEPLYFLASVVV